MNNAFLSIHPDQVTFSSPAISLPVGYASVAGRFFRHRIPSPYDVEMAIATIEDCIQAETGLHAVAGTFRCSDDYLKAISRIAGELNPLTQGDIEDLFNRVADVVSGSPWREEAFPDDPHFISYLIILRELSHHLNIQNIYLPESENRASH
ncbi:hypothetical protein [Klebsiella sp. 2680]|uniref:hypothetical protein n=1 Tax=Klebsiella sp. 2680 TaxID=2018037 RepID=UPI00115708E3|nr:hypothetical protein [Klebsiella sp. 2680]